MPEMHLIKSRFTCSASGPITKTIIRKFKETRDLRYIYQNQINEACFQHYMADGEFKDLPGRAASDKVLHDKAFNIVENPKHDVYQRGLASLVDKLFDKEFSCSHVKG